MANIAIIDTGCVDSFFTNNKLAEFYTISDDKIVKCNPCDKNGHGTACAYLIDSLCFNNNFFIYKIFDDQLVTSSQKLIVALRDCLKSNYDIINLSLGCISYEAFDELEAICNELYKNNTLLICAGNEDQKKCYPADFSFSIKVLGHSKNPREFFKDKNNNVLRAYSGNQRVKWNNNRYNIVYGTSFACARVTGYIANSINNNLNYKSIVSKLKTYTDTLARDFLGDLNYVDWARHVLVFPFNKEVHSIIKFEDVLPFEINSIVDFSLLGNVGKTPKELLVKCKNSCVIQGKFADSITDNIDTILFGDLSEVSRIYNKNQLEKYSNIAFEKGKNVISIEFLEEKIYFKIKAEAEKHSCNFCCLNDYIIRDLETISPNIKSSVPIITILGTSSKVGKFTFQMTLNNILSKIGYNVSMICTEPHAYLFGKKTLPLGNYNLLNVVPFHKQLDFMRNLIMTAIDENPELIITSGQSGLVPYSQNVDVDFTSLSSIITILASKPDAAILCINYDDSIDYIKRTIKFIESFGYGKVIMCSLSCKSKVVQKKGNLLYKKQFYYASNEIKEKIEYIENEIRIPVINILDEKDLLKCVNTIQKFFSIQE